MERSPLSSTPSHPACIHPVTVERSGGSFFLRTALWLPLPREEVFPFFADAGNLERITPAILRFQVTTPGPIEMRPGALIDYRLKIRGMPIRWRTRIAAWEPPHRFVDEQLRGPYRRWVHEHTFEESEGGTMCRDVVEYRVPGGALVNRLLVERDVRSIFEFRQRTLADIFASPREVSSQARSLDAVSA